jgi:hypothetical protein
MPNYYPAMLSEMNTKHTDHIHSPLLYTPPSYGTIQSQTERVDRSLPASTEDQLRLQTGIGKLSYIAIAIDHLILPAVSKLASVQSKPTIETMKIFDRLMQYVATHNNPTIIYRPSNMQLQIHTDASFMTETRCRSRAAVFGYLSSKSISNIPDFPDLNGAIICTSTIIPLTVPSVMDAEYIAIYQGLLHTNKIRETLSNLGFPQQFPTELICDNQAAVSVANETCTIKKSKTSAMRYYIIQDNIHSKKLKVTWRPGKDPISDNPTNLADAFTKAHPIYYFKKVKPYYNSDVT